MTQTSSSPNTSHADQWSSWRQDRLKNQLEGLRAALQRTDRILSGKPGITVSLDNLGLAGFPAQSSGLKIQVNMDRVKSPEKKSGLVLILALNYHELAHVEHSPHPNLLNVGKINTKGSAQAAYMYLEEGRIETRFVAQYGKMAKYFAYPVVEYLVNDPSAWPTAFLLTHGRKYLPREIRDSFREIFEKRYGKKATYNLADLIDRFRVLGFDSGRNNVQRAKDIIAAFADILADLGISGKPKCPVPRLPVAEKWFPAGRNSEVRLLRGKRIIAE